MKKIFSTFVKGIEIFLGISLIVVGIGIGLENWQASLIMNIPSLVFSVSAILVGALFLWLVFKNYEKM